MNKRQRNYDSECETLARYFYPAASDDFIIDLANDFQSQVEARCSHEGTERKVNGDCVACGEAAEKQEIPDGWCPICGGQDGAHKSGCEDGSEIL